MAPAAKRRRLACGFPASTPAAEGMDEEPLKRCRSAVSDEVHKFGSLNGVAHLVLRNGRCVFSHADGLANIKAKAPFTVRTLCRLHSCTKPLTIAAFLTLVDDGSVRLSDPVSKYVGYSKVVAERKGTRATGKGPMRAMVRPSKSTPTLKHLLAMQGGLEYNDSKEYSALMDRVKKKKIKDLATFCDELFKVPLCNDPGSHHEYSFCCDVIARICEVVSGKPLDIFIKRRLLEPLGMRDTHHNVPASKLRRRAELYNCRKLHTAKERRKAGTPYQADLWGEATAHPDLLSGGGGFLSYSDAGMWSTVQDYARFCQMLLNNGVAPGGKRVLKASTVRLLWRDGLAPFAKSDGRCKGWNDFGGSDAKENTYWDHHAWSLLNTTLDLKDPPKSSGAAREGRTMWMYGMGAYWLIDKRRKMVLVSFAQCFSDRAEQDGSDCAAFAKAAVDKGAARLKSPGKEAYYGKG